jgi:ABC-type glucose/galactose transport system permease subunit
LQICIGCHQFFESKNAIVQYTLYKKIPVYGGTGKVSGAVIGAIFMGVLNNGMSILGIDSNWQKVVKGSVLLGAVIFDVISKRRAGGLVRFDKKK